jgi:eukaryotic-like serine/threonine-protein kinase
MSGDPRVQELIEEILESGGSAEDVCRACPELLPEVREAWRRFRAIEAQVGALFPEPESTIDREATAPEIGPPRISGYEILEVLGRGGVGVVYKAVHIRLNRLVALKMLLAGAFATRAERRRFSREAELVAKLRHPNIVQVHDVGDLDGRPYFTMEFVEGGSLAEWIAGTPRPARQAAELMATLADAMEAAHRGGIVHRDLKPSNVLLTADGTPKIGDFGLARHLEVGPSLTQSGAAVGTPSYMAPEQARGKSGEAGPAADLYALGAVLYELLTGRPPFRAESASETLHQVITRDPVPPSRLNAKVPRDLETICLKCLRKEPQLRYDRSSELAEDLRRFLRGETIAARPENWLQRLARRVHHRPAFSAAVVVGTLLTLTMGGTGLWLISERAETARKAVIEESERTRKRDAERAAIEQAADGDLREMTGWMKKSAWPEAAAALERARGRLGESGPADLRRRLAQGASDLGLVARLETIRLGGASSVGGKLGIKRSVKEYLQAIQEAGLGRVGDEHGAVASRLRTSNVKSALVAMLDFCAFLAEDEGQRDWLIAVARLADEGATEWRNRVRDPANWKDKTAFARLIETAPVADESLPLLLGLVEHWSAIEENSVPFMKRVQQAHPGDFWANLGLGNALHKKSPEEAMRYYQAALAIRPGTGVVYNALGMALSSTGRFEEAVELLRQAVRIDPMAAQGHHNLAQALQRLGKYDEAIEQSRLALSSRPELALLHRTLAFSLEAKGRHDEAISEYQKAVTLSPSDTDSQQRLRTILIRQGRLDEARAAWENALATNPPEHAAWYGYAELCLFLGQEDEYRGARQALLARFGEVTDPYIAERTARACLLRPASEDELRRVVILAKHSWGVEPSKYGGVYPHFLFLRGLAEYRRGHLDRAISTMRGDASRVLGPAPGLVVAMALHRDGQVVEARKTLAAAVTSHDWRAARVLDQDGWIYHSLRREAESMILPELRAFLEGTYHPRDNDERLALLGVCQFTDRPVASARLYANAFAADPRLAEDLRAGHRYNATRAAALSGCSRGVDAAELGEPERLRWREQSRDWLRSDLAAWNKLLADPMTARDPVRTALSRWHGEPDLAGLREPAELEKLSDDERKDCLALWDEVGVVLRRTGPVR